MSDPPRSAPPRVVRTFHPAYPEFCVICVTCVISLETRPRFASPRLAFASLGQKLRHRSWDQIASLGTKLHSFVAAVTHMTLMTQMPGQPPRTLPGTGGGQNG